MSTKASLTESSYKRNKAGKEAQILKDWTTRSLDFSIRFTRKQHSKLFKLSLYLVIFGYLYTHELLTRTNSLKYIVQSLENYATDSSLRRGSRGGEMGEFSPPPPLFLSLLLSFFSDPSNIEIIFGFSDIITKIHPPFQNPGSALESN